MNPEELLNALSLLFIFIVGLGLGTQTTINDFKNSILHKPKAVSIGLLSQYFFMPLISYILVQIFHNSLDKEIIMGIVLVGCSPGGSTSNLFTYWSLGDVALSITMSFLSTIFAFFMLPLLLWFILDIVMKINENENNENDTTKTQIAYTNLIASLLMLVIPTVIGIYIRKVNTEYKLCGKYIWEWITLLTTIVGILFMILALLSVILFYSDIIFGQDDSSYSIWIIGTLMQPIGCFFGYYTAKLVGRRGGNLNHKDQRTISLETGVQNFSLAFAIANLSFGTTSTPTEDDDGEGVHKAIVFPMVYGCLYVINTAIIVSFYRWYLAPKDTPEEDEVDDGNKDVKNVDDDDNDDIDNKKQVQEMEEQPIPTKSTSN